MFWDLRDTFLFRLYRGNVEDARLDSVLPHVDTVRYECKWSLFICVCMHMCAHMEFLSQTILLI